ncbi:MAG: sulfur carrier protein ThiS [Gammaproteobacteria bacterium]|jgi:sulfur carrier protein ThiS
MPQDNRFKSCEVTITDNDTLGDALAQLPIPAETAYMVIVNDEKIRSENFNSIKINASDEIVLLPPIKGG